MGWSYCGCRVKKKRLHLFQPSRADQMSIKVDLTSEGDKGFNFAFVIPAASSFHDASPQNNSGISS